MLKNAWHSIIICCYHSLFKNLKFRKKLKEKNSYDHSTLLMFKFALSISNAKGLFLL